VEQHTSTSGEIGNSMRVNKLILVPSRLRAFLVNFSSE